MTWTLFWLRVWLNRRRVAVFLAITLSCATLGASAASVGAKSDMDELLPGALAIAALTGSAAAILCTWIAALWPTLRGIPECLSLGMIALMPLSLADASGLLPASDLARIMLWAVLFGCLFGLMSRPGHLSFGRRRDVTLTGEAKSWLSPDALWPWLASTPDCNMGARSQRLRDLRWIEPGKSYSYVSNAGILAKMEARIELVARPEQMIVGCQADPDLAGRLLNPKGRITTRFTTHRSGSVVSQTHELHATTARIRALLWLDDAFSRQLVEGIAEAEASSRVESGSD